MEQEFFCHHICAKIQESFLSVKVLSQRQSIADKQVSLDLANSIKYWKWPATVGRWSFFFSMAVERQREA